MDWYANYTTACNNCADLTDASNRVFRGGSFTDFASYLRSADRSFSYLPDYHIYYFGARCARTSL